MPVACGAIFLNRMQDEIFEQLQKGKIIGETVVLCKKNNNACGGYATPFNLKNFVVVW
jgi:hypothetical protein